MPIKSRLFTFLLTVNHSIISTVLQWDMRDLKSRASKFEKDRPGLEKEQLDTLKSYGELSREQHERLRSKSSKQVVPNGGRRDMADYLRTGVAIHCVCRIVGSLGCINFG